LRRKRKNMLFKALSALIVLTSAVSVSGSPINLGTAGAFGLLGGTISNTGTSVVNGEVGATITVTGFPPGVATGGVFTGGAVSGPYTDFESALTFGSGEASTQTASGLAVSQTFLGNNVYAFPNVPLTTSTAGIILTFDAQSNSSASFVLQFPGALTIDGPITFNLINGAQASNIYWVIGTTASPEAATIDPSGVPIIWDGDILAGTVTVSANTGGSGVLASVVNGCVLAVNANTLAGQTDVNGCSATGVSTPEPGSAGLLAAGCLLGLGLRKVRSSRVRN